MVLMFNLPLTEASRRMQSLNDILRDTAPQWTNAPVKVSVSHGVAGFASLTRLGQAIEEADTAMYDKRRMEGRRVGKMRHQRSGDQAWFTSSGRIKR